MDVYSIVTTGGVRIGLFLANSEGEALADLKANGLASLPASEYRIDRVSIGEVTYQQLRAWFGELEADSCRHAAPDLTGKGQHPDIDVWTATHTIRVGDTRIHVTIAYEFDIETLPVSEEGRVASDGRRHDYPEDSSDLNWDAARTGYTVIY